MKKLNSLLLMALVAMMSLTFTSCDDDANVADTLYGTWKGYMDIGVRNRYDNRYYTSTTSEITFNTNGNYTDHGDGYWIDRYSNAPWDYVANHIEWTVNNGVIRVYFVEEGTYATIRNYSLNDDYFYGTLVSGDSKADFKLVKTSSPNRWNYYWYDTDDWYNSWNGYGYAKAHKTSDFSSRSSGKDSLKYLERVVNYQGK